MLKLPVSFLVIFIPTCQGIIVKCVDLDIRVYVKAFQLKKATDAMKAKIIQQINDYNHLDYPSVGFLHGMKRSGLFQVFCIKKFGIASELIFRNSSKGTLRCFDM